MAFSLIAASAGAGVVLAARQRARRLRAWDVAGKVVFVTGGSRGLGLILCRKLAQAGARVCLAGRDADSLDRAREIIRHEAVPALSAPYPADVYTFVCDVTQPDQIREALRAAEAQTGGPIDILINNAGTIEVGPMETMTDADYETALQTHFWGPYHAIQAVLPAMRARRAGRIVNIASIGGKVAVPHLLPYSTSKFALVGFSEGLRAELLKDGIYVTTVCPGLIRTGSPRNATFKGKHTEEYGWFALSDALPGISMSADDCADQIIEALRFGDAEIVTSLPGKIAALAHGVAPALVADALGQIARLLPGPGDAGTERHSGAESESPLTRSRLTALSRQAERQNNQW